MVDKTKAFARRRKLSATIWITLALCAGVTLVQVVFAPSLLLVALTIALGVLAWSERRACGMFARNDPRGATLGFWNQIILGIIACAYLLWQSWSAPHLRAELDDWGVPTDMAASLIASLQQGYLLTAIVVLVSQVAVAIYYVRIRRGLGEN